MLGLELGLGLGLWLGLWVGLGLGIKYHSRPIIGWPKVCWRIVVDKKSADELLWNQISDADE